MHNALTVDDILHSGKRSFLLSFESSEAFFGRRTFGIIVLFSEALEWKVCVGALRRGNYRRYELQS